MGEKGNWRFGAFKMQNEDEDEDESTTYPFR
jgi:hypothetical protein